MHFSVYTPSVIIELFNLCVVGLGNINEKLQNGEDLSASDFQLESNVSSRYENSELDTGSDEKSTGFKTPLLKCISDASYSPSLFPPDPQDADKGK